MKNLIEENIEVNRRIRLKLDIAIHDIEGNLLEIGAGHGQSTVYLCKVARKQNRKVLVIDPFGGEMPDSYRYNYSLFKKAIEPWKDIVILHKFPSQDKNVPEFLKKNGPIAFAFVDGLQYKDAVLSDLKLMDQFNVPIFAVDDAERSTGISQVPLALKEFEGNKRYVHVKTETREAYFYDRSNYPEYK